MDTPNQEQPSAQVQGIPPGTPPTTALWYAFKSAFPSTAAKVGYWRPFVLALMAYMGYDKHTDKVRHDHRIQQVEETVSNVQSFVVAPPTNGRRIHEFGNTNTIRRK